MRAAAHGSEQKWRNLIFSSATGAVPSTEPSSSKEGNGGEGEGVASGLQPLPVPDRHMQRSA